MLNFLLKKKNFVDVAINHHIANEIRQLDTAVEASVADQQKNRAAIREELQKIMPDNTSKESTLQAFQRLSNNLPWIPFRSPNSETPETAIDKEEAELFDAWLEERKYCLEAKSGPRSFNAFHRDWNREVSRRFRVWSQGDEGIILIRCKS